MIQAYNEGKDLYATIAADVYSNDYWDNMEHHQDGTPNPEGKKRRSACKSILLGIMYGRGAQSISQQIGSTKEESQKIIDTFFEEFPKVKTWMDETLNNAKKVGYVEDLWGRRRHLPQLLLPKFEVNSTLLRDDDSCEFNPFLECLNRLDIKQLDIINSIKNDLNNAKSRQTINSIIRKTNREHPEIKIIDNSGIIAGEERKCVNARIQGGAATMTKIAMIKLFNDEELSKLGFKLLIGVHDELIGECPKENAQKVAERVTYIMKTCIDDIVDVKFKCDADICDSWYINDYIDNLRKDYHCMIEDLGLDADSALEKIIQDHEEFDAEFIRKNILGE